ncbi:class I SAM-dependent methyltransferase [Anaerococcus vaginalis]|uniref:tRNA (mnm(5)s(2)U34)-methyltransferase n=1 Tax=Anaerococcus vaginalis TaxID=33037 RepID=UPI0029159017|nr:class I SAM-dependent methyltransferase [Anaerococcus vaginalis]MDU5825064.1 class I SAM-dependent methyltransferase [Anaerococcus vaginalis]
MIYTDEIINNPVKLSHYLIEHRVENNIRACDMTAGNGKDSKFILDNKNPNILYAFDIQKLSQERCKKLIGQKKNFKFILDDHKNIEKYIKEKIDLFIYNLGFLPKGDKSITTNYKSVIQSLKSCLDLLNEKGLILITFYPGHEEGKNEEKYVGEFLKNLDQKTFQVIKYNFYNQINNPPFLISIRKV